MVGSERSPEVPDGSGMQACITSAWPPVRLPAICQFNSFLVVLSVVFAVLISLAALWIPFTPT